MVLAFLFGWPPAVFRLTNVKDGRGKRVCDKIFPPP
jgi:hypothetical protein